MVKNRAILVTSSIIIALSFVGCSKREQSITSIETEKPEVGEWFASDSDSMMAKNDIDIAKSVYDSIVLENSKFLQQENHNCSSHEMEESLNNLYKIEITSDKYLEKVTNTDDYQDRKAGLDVVDELNAMVLDGYIDIADSYTNAGCKTKAKAIYSKLLKIYTGNAFVKWRNAASEKIELINSEKLKKN